LKCARLRCHGRIADARQNPCAQAERFGAAWLRAVIETAVDGVILIDAEGTVLMFNPACEKLFKYQAEEVIGQNVKTLMPGHYRDAHDGYL
jgi:two-component system sensor kinase FixL